MALSAGTRLGPYEILLPLGAGGMGEVYRARDTRLDRFVAVKVLASNRMDSEEMRLRLDREARAVSSLNHPHICTLYDIGREGGADYLVMECLEGETLATQPRWSSDGAEVFFISEARQLTAVPVQARDGQLNVGSAKPLFENIFGGTGVLYDVSPDGRRFLVNTPSRPDLISPLTLRLNWTASLSR